MIYDIRLLNKTTKEYVKKVYFNIAPVAGDIIVVNENEDFIVEKRILSSDNPNEIILLGEIKEGFYV